MFENLTEQLSQTFKKITGKDKLNEKNISNIIEDVRIALLNADVALEVVNDFIIKLQQKILGQEIPTGLSSAQYVVKMVNSELTDLMGGEKTGLSLRASPTIIMLVGLQGSGKTTTAGKLAKFLQDKEKKSVALVSADVYRPAAIEQLATVADKVNAKFIKSTTDQTPESIVKSAVEIASNEHIDVLIVDTAGRLHIDEQMMMEVTNLHKILCPAETLFVVDSMTGQDAINVTKSFNNALSLTGIILTKTDGDAKGGAALSVSHVTGRPVKFIGTGEKLDALDYFYPDRIASRILGMGDILSLIEDIESKVDKKKSEKLSKKLKKGGGFDFNDLREQLAQMNKMGGIENIMSKLPTAGNLPEAKINNKEIMQMTVVIDSMTKKERVFPDLIKGSRKRRIARGAGVDIQIVNKTLKQHSKMQKIMKKMLSKSGNAKMMKLLQKLPPS